MVDIADKVLADILMLDLSDIEDDDDRYYEAA